MDPEKSAHPQSLIRIIAVCLQTLLQEEKLIAKIIDLDPCWSQTHYAGFFQDAAHICLPYIKVIVT
jgi:hypothetical protein